MNFEKKSFFLRKAIPHGHSKILSKVCSHFTSVVHNVNISFDKKVDGLYNLWVTLQSFVHEKSEELDEFLDFICHWSLNIMLSDEWDSFKSISKMWFLNTIKLSKLQICKAYHGVSTQSIDTLIKLCEKPWNIPFLDKIFNNEQVEKEDILEYYNEESTCVFERIKVLCGSQCEDLAFQLVDHCLTVAHDKQRELLQEIHFILLLILKRKEDLVNKLRELSIDGSIDLVDSFILYSNLENLNPQTSSLYNCLESLVKESLEVLLKRVVLDDDLDNFYKVMDKWMDSVVMKMSDQNQATSYLSSIADMFISSDQLFHLCGKLNYSMLERDKKLCIKTLMRALTLNSNEFEIIEDKDDKKRSVQRLANGFLQLASLMEYSGVITRECMLSSFSLYPTNELLQKMNKELCTLQSHSSDSLWSDGAIVGLSQQECDDLIILLHVHRNASLSWNLEKENLLENCLTHMSNYNNLFEQVPLKYLNIDYSQFDNVPRPEPGFYEGIEKGYEKYLEGFSVQNVKDVVEELRFLKVDDSNKKVEELENTNGETVPVEDCNVEIVDEEEQGIHSLKYPQHQAIDFQTPYDSNVQNNNVERKSETNTKEVFQDPMRTRTLTARHILDAQKPLIVKINVGNTRKSNVKVRARKKPKKKKSKENKLEIAFETLATLPSQVPMGLKRVMYPQKTKPSDSSVLKDFSQQPEQEMIEHNQKHVFQSSLEEPPVKIIKQGNTLEFSTNYIDLSSYESVSNLVSGGGGSNIQVHNETQSTNYTSSDYEFSHNSVPIPLGSQDLKFVHFDMDTHHIYQEHNYFSTKFQNPEYTSDSDSDLNDEDFVNVEEDDGSDVDVEGLNELALTQTAAQMLSNSNCPRSSRFYENRDQEIESKLLSSTLGLNVEFTRDKELVDLASLLHYRQA
uniref:Uncharacterized protein n=1 Tax=Cacopsylla melanoneura TaxID=428564 RepID=A0A8D8T2F4_9HEMI